MYILLNVWLHYEQVIADNHLAAMAIGEIALEDTLKAGRRNRLPHYQ